MAQSRYRKTSLITVILTFIFLLISLKDIFAIRPSLSVMNRVSSAVTKVTCQGGGAGTGFVWSQRDKVVTALHVVVGCNRILVDFQNAGVRRPARIERVLKHADLALLHVENPPNLSPLTSALNNPELHDELVAMGYEFDAPTMSSKNLEMSFGSSELQDILPAPARLEVSRAGMPSLSLQVLRLQGHLVPGLSGAPIINHQGLVVAVADGGLESGAASTSWALPVENVNRLITSRESVAVISRSTKSITKTLFRADREVERGPEIRCGGMTLTKLRTRSYAELRRTTDDPEGTEVIKQIAELAEIDVSRLVFDIYVHSSSGATLAVPSGLSIIEDGRDCVTTAFDGALQLRVRGAWPTNTRRTAQQFLDETMIATGLGWTPEPGFTYDKPHARFDGFNVNRASYHGADKSDVGLLYGVPTVKANAFETSLARGETFLGLIIFNYDNRTFRPEVTIQCAMLPNNSICQYINAEQRLWISMLLGAYLSTFPVG